MEVTRSPLQGGWNIIRFNWHFYLFSGLLILLLLFLLAYTSPPYRVLLQVGLLVVVATTMISLLVSFYVYDWSDLYKLTWLDHLSLGTAATIVNINAGFDETSILLQRKFPIAELLVLDFYDPLKHTEISLQRARKAYPPFPATQAVKTTHLPLAENSIDAVFALLAAHEIRNSDERALFFTELHRVMKPTGQIIVVEHLRDAANFLAYNVGCRHFHSYSTWLRSFSAAGLALQQELKITPFITAFVLRKNGIAP